jgi:hypothetical protein
MLLLFPRYADDHHQSNNQEDRVMAVTPQSHPFDLLLSRQATGDLRLRDDDDHTCVSAVEITLWADATHGTGGIALMNPAGTWAKHFDLPATFMCPLLEAVFRPDPGPGE